MPKKISQQESVFDPLEQYHLSHGEFHYVMLNKINMMSFEAFEFESLFIFFQEFMRYVPGRITRSLIDQYQCVKKFAEDKSIKFQVGQGVSQSLLFHYNVLLMIWEGWTR